MFILGGGGGSLSKLMLKRIIVIKCTATREFCSHFYFYFILTQKHLDLLDHHLKGTTSERPAEIYGEGNERNSA